MDRDEIRALLRSARTAILATIGPDGVPDPVPMWFVLRGDDLWMRTYAKSQKARNVDRDPRVSVVIEDGDRYAQLRGVQFTGHVDVSVDIDVICALAADLLVKYEGLDPADREAVMTAYRPTAAKQIAMRLVVDRTASWDHAKIVPGT